jgi:hypothetical protein
VYGKDMKKLTIGLDFDDTVTKDMAMFIEIVGVMVKYGCDVYIITARGKNHWCEDLRKFVDETGLTVIFSDTKAKHDVAEIDIWIDDFPLAITHHWKEYAFTPSDATKEWVR